MKNKNSFGRSLLLSLGGLALLLSLNASRISAQTKLGVKVHISPTANKNNPVAVDLVLVSDKKLLKELMQMSAKEWFEQRHQVQLDYPKEKDLSAGSWEWVPGQAVQLDRLSVRRGIVGGIVFANYFTEGAHRAAINPRKAILLTLGEDDLCVQSAKEVARPCTLSTKPTKNAIADKPRYQHRRRSLLVWDQVTLRQAIGVYEQYRGKLDDSVKNAARTRVRARIRNILTHAQRYEPLPPIGEGSARRASLIEEIRLLQEAQPLLARALQIAAELGVGGTLRVALNNQGNRLLTNIHREFVAQRFYVGRQNDYSVEDFSWWDGRQPVSYLTYDLASKEEVASYLNVQRKNISLLTRDLYVPVMTFFASQQINLQPSGQVNWDQILADLDAYDNKTSGNPIAALENFIRADMDRVSIDSCYGMAQIDEQRSTDYFLSIRNSLRVRFYERCKLLAHAKAIDDTIDELKNYGEIEKSFNDNLAGAFPFAQVNAPQLAPWAMLKFFKVLRDNEKAAREALDHSKSLGATPDKIKDAKEFLDQIDRVREFFAPFIDKEQDPSFDFQVQFRVNREQEIAANQIIEWKLEVGKKKFNYLSNDLTGHWTYGEPVRLTLRWANDSPRRPLPGVDPMLVSVKGRSAIFEHNDRWSLFTLLLRHGLQLKRTGASAECDQGYDADPYTLKFIVKTATDPAAQFGQPNGLTPPVAEVFMRITLFERGKSAPIMIPCFPTKAPPVPFLSAPVIESMNH